MMISRRVAFVLCALVIGAAVMAKIFQKAISYESVTLLECRVEHGTRDTYYYPVCDRKGHRKRTAWLPGPLFLLDEEVCSSCLVGDHHCQRQFAVGMDPGEHPDDMESAEFDCLCDEPTCPTGIHEMLTLRQTTGGPHSKYGSEPPILYSDLEALLDFLDRPNPPECDHTLREARQFLEERELPTLMALEWLQAHGGHCDCEVVYNVENQWGERVGRVRPSEPYDVVLTSTRVDEPAVRERLRKLGWVVNDDKEHTASKVFTKPSLAEAEWAAVDELTAHEIPVRYWVPDADPQEQAKERDVQAYLRD